MTSKVYLTFSVVKSDNSVVILEKKDLSVLSKPDQKVIEGAWLLNVSTEGFQVGKQILVDLIGTVKRVSKNEKDEKVLVPLPDRVILTYAEYTVETVTSKDDKGNETSTTKDGSLIQSWSYTVGDLRYASQVNFTWIKRAERKNADKPEEKKESTFASELSFED